MITSMFATYITHTNEPSGGPAAKWHPVNTTTVILDSGEVLVLQKQSHVFEIGSDVQMKVVAFAAYHQPTNTIYYYAPGPVVEAPADWIDPADWRLAHPDPDKKRGQPKEG